MNLLNVWVIDIARFSLLSLWFDVFFNIKPLNFSGTCNCFPNNGLPLNEADNIPVNNNVTKNYTT